MRPSVFLIRFPHVMSGHHVRGGVKEVSTLISPNWYSPVQSYLGYVLYSAKGLKGYHAIANVYISMQHTT